MIKKLLVSFALIIVKNGVLILPEAVQKLTSFSAGVLGISNRGGSKQA
jgi:hypothetical protein